MYRALLIVSREEVNSMDFYTCNLCLSICSDRYRCCTFHLPCLSPPGCGKETQGRRIQPFHGSPAPGGLFITQSCSSWGAEHEVLSPSPSQLPGPAPAPCFSQGGSSGWLWVLPAAPQGSPWHQLGKLRPSRLGKSPLSHPPPPAPRPWLHLTLPHFPQERKGNLTGGNLQLTNANPSCHGLSLSSVLSDRQGHSRARGSLPSCSQWINCCVSKPRLAVLGVSLCISGSDVELSINELRLQLKSDQSLAPAHIHSLLQTEEQGWSQDIIIRE